MKIGQLIEYNMRNIFVEKTYAKCGIQAIPRLLSKTSKLSISLDRQGKALTSLLILHANLQSIEI